MSTRQLMAITAKDLVPGRIITSLEWPPGWSNRPVIEARVIPWLIISVSPRCKRRHARAKAKYAGWDVVLFRIGLWEGDVLRSFDFTESDMKSWKRLS